MVQDEEEEEEEEDSSVLFTFHALPRSSSNTAVACSWLVCWFWCFSRCVPFVFQQAPAARYHGAMDEKDICAVAAPVVDSGGGMCYAGIAGCGSPARYVPFCCRQAQDGLHHGRYDQKDLALRRLRQWHVQGLVCVVFTRRDVVLSVVGRPRCSASWPV